MKKKLGVMMVSSIFTFSGFGMKLPKNQQNLSIQQLADKAKVSGHTIFRVRSSAFIRCTSLGTLEKIAEALGCSPKQLFEYEPNRYYENFPKLR